MGTLGAVLYDWFMLPQERTLFRQRRTRVAGGARGRILEIGMGTGLNLPYYLPEQVKELVGLEPDEAMAVRAHRRAENLPLPVVFAETSAEILPFDDAYFDTVVGTLVLCSVPDPLKALREARRVLKKDGELRLLEHVQSAHPRRATLQNAFTPIWKSLFGGCHLNREALILVEQAGFQVKRVLTYESWKLFPAFRLDEITAVPQ